MIEHLKSLAYTGGAWVIYLLIGCSVLAVAVIIERAILLKKERKLLGRIREFFLKEELKGLAENAEGTTGFSSSVLLTIFGKGSKSAVVVEEEMNATLVSGRKRLEKRMIILGTLGNNAVYIGLFGTVLGVIKAFHDLAEGSSMGPEVVMQGLSEALIATAAGLLVAIPSVISFNILQKEIKDLVSETESMAGILLSQLKSEKK